MTILMKIVEICKFKHLDCLVDRRSILRNYLSFFHASRLARRGGYNDPDSHQGRCLLSGRRVVSDAPIVSKVLTAIANVGYLLGLSQVIWNYLGSTSRKSKEYLVHHLQNLRVSTFPCPSLPKSGMKAAQFWKGLFVGRTWVSQPGEIQDSKLV